MANGNGTLRSVGIGIAIAVCAALIIATATTSISSFGTLRVHKAELEHLEGRIGWWSGEVKRLSERAIATESNVQTIEALFVRIEARLEGIEAKLEARNGRPDNTRPRVAGTGAGRD